MGWDDRSKTYSMTKTPPGMNTRVSVHQITISDNTLGHLLASHHKAVEPNVNNPITPPWLRTGSGGAWVMIFTQSWLHLLLNSTGILNSWS